MAQSHKTSNLWEFRKHDDPESSYQDPQLSSSEQHLKNLNQISHLNPTKSQLAADVHLQHHLINRPVHKDSRMQFMNHWVKVDRSYCRKMKGHSKDGKGKNSQRKREPATISSNLILMQSILEELRVEGEHLLEWMRGEVNKINDDAMVENAASEGSSKWKIKIKLSHDQ